MNTGDSLNMKRYTKNDGYKGLVGAIGGVRTGGNIGFKVQGKTYAYSGWLEESLRLGSYQSDLSPKTSEIL